MLKWKDRKFQEALKSINNAIEIDSDNPVLYSNRAVIKFELNDIEGMVHDLSKCIQINPKDASIYLLRGDLKVNLENYEGAFFDYEKCVDLDSSMYEAYNNWAITLLVVGKVDEALDKMKECVDMGNINEVCVSNYEAISKYKKAIEEGPLIDTFVIPERIELEQETLGVTLLTSLCFHSY